MTNHALILAAGKGTRMKTELPKTLFPILKKPMIEYILDEVEKTSIKNIHLVVGHKKDLLKDHLDTRVTYVDQDEQLGTGHAVMQAKETLAQEPGSTIILPGDMPLIDHRTLDSIISSHNKSNAPITLVTTRYENPHGYGRILRDSHHNIIGIIEELSANQPQKAIKEVNTGILVIRNDYLFNFLDLIKKDPKKGEYYLTDIVAIFVSKGHKVNSYTILDNSIVMGVNDLVAIAEAEKYFRNKINQMHMLNGISLINPETITIGHEVELSAGVIIYPNTTITGKTQIEANAVVGPNTELHNATIKKEAQIRHSLIYDSEVGQKTTVGPFAHLRNKAIIGDNNRIGNFVEVKNSKTGNETKASHLAYIGDARVGNNVNFGAGSITVNYDGVKKHQTIIGNDVFIGCNTNLVAPIKIENKVFVAAGSTVTEDIPEGSLTIERGQQINKRNYYKNLIRPSNQ